MSVRESSRTRGGDRRLRRVARRCLPLLAAVEVALLAGAAAPAAAPSPASAAPAMAALTEAVGPSVVDTITFAAPAGTQILGTGIILSATGLVLTDYHVIRGDVFIGVRVGGVGEIRQAIVVTSDPADDLALLQIQGGPAVRPAPLAGASSAKVGDHVMAIGNAMGLGVVPQAASGRLLALNRPLSYGVGSDEVSLTRTMEATAPIFTGDSGGPLVDAQGRVIGIIAAGSDNAPCAEGATCPLHLAFAIPIRRALAQIDFSSSL